MATASPIIKVTDVTLTQHELLVLDSVSLSIQKGEFTAIVGPNGAGKTTLVKVILGLIKPSSGSVEVFGIPLSQLGCERAKIGYVPQIFAVDMNFPVTVYETVLMGTYGRLGIGKRPGRREHEDAVAAMEKVGIQDLKDRPIRRLSGGQRQRAFIARALATKPELLVLDEPTTGVDVATTGSLYTLLRQLRSEGVTVVIVSHDIGVVASFIDKVACLNKTVISHCKPEELRGSNALSQMYGSDAAYLHHGTSHYLVKEDS